MMHASDEEPDFYEQDDPKDQDYGAPSSSSSGGAGGKPKAKRQPTGLPTGKSKAAAALAAVTPGGEEDDDDDEYDEERPKKKKGKRMTIAQMREEAAKYDLPNSVIGPASRERNIKIAQVFEGLAYQVSLLPMARLKLFLQCAVYERLSLSPLFSVKRTQITTEGQSRKAVLTFTAALLAPCAASLGVSITAPTPSSISRASVRVSLSILTLSSATL
jgi:hypothetical protein